MSWLTEFPLRYRGNYWLKIELIDTLKDKGTTVSLLCNVP